MSDEVLRLEAVTKSYADSQVVTPVLHGIDLALGAGELAALTGPSGSGKSTLLNLVGLLDRPSSGRVLIDGRDTGPLADEELTRLRGRTIGFVFQFHHLLPAFSALENVMMPLLARRGRPDAATRRNALELLAEVGLADRAHRRTGELSGGQQQRVAVARALVMEPALVLADEPTGNLDTEASEQVFGLLGRVSRERRATLLLVTHDPRLADRCDRIVHLVDGRVRADTRRP